MHTHELSLHTPIKTPCTSIWQGKDHPSRSHRQTCDQTFRFADAVAETGSFKRAKIFSVSADASQPDQTPISKAHSPAGCTTAEKPRTLWEQAQGCKFTTTPGPGLFELLQESDSSSKDTSKLFCLCRDIVHSCPEDWQCNLQGSLKKAHRTQESLISSETELSSFLQQTLGRILSKDCYFVETVIVMRICSPTTVTLQASMKVCAVPRSCILNRCFPYGDSQPSYTCMNHVLCKNNWISPLWQPKGFLLLALSVDMPEMLTSISSFLQLKTRQCSTGWVHENAMEEVKVMTTMPKKMTGQTRRHQRQKKVHPPHNNSQTVSEGWGLWL